MTRTNRTKRTLPGHLPDKPDKTDIARTFAGQNGHRPDKTDISGNAEPDTLGGIYIYKYIYPFCPGQPRHVRADRDAIATEQLTNWMRTGCTPADCLQTLGVLDEVRPDQRTWSVVFLATYQSVGVRS
jgi:hypothetical protein